MAESEKGNDPQRPFDLKPFFQRACEAEDRLSRLEAALASKKDTGNEEHSKLMSELQSKLEDANVQLISEQEKSQRLAEENARLHYRIHHLIRAIRESDHKLEQEQEKFQSLFLENAQLHLCISRLSRKGE